MTIFTDPYIVFSCLCHTTSSQHRPRITAILVSRFLLDLQAANEDSQKGASSSHPDGQAGSLVFAAAFGAHIDSRDIASHGFEDGGDDGAAENVESVHA